MNDKNQKSNDKQNFYALKSFSKRCCLCTPFEKLDLNSKFRQMSFVFLVVQVFKLKKEQKNCFALVCGSAKKRN